MLLEVAEHLAASWHDRYLVQYRFSNKRQVIHMKVMTRGSSYSLSIRSFDYNDTLVLLIVFSFLGTRPDMVR